MSLRDARRNPVALIYLLGHDEIYKIGNSGSRMHLLKCTGMYNVKPETTLSKPEFYEATASGGSPRGLMVYTGLAIFLQS